LSIDDRRNGIANIHLAVRNEEVSQSLPLELSVCLWIPDIEPQPRSVTQILATRTGMRRIKIDKRARHAISKYAVARARISVTNHLATTLEITVRCCVVHRP
jgi:hypothetical protein